MANLTTRIGKLLLKNPVATASGTFGYGTEYADFIDIAQLGAFFTKGLTREPQQGNPAPRSVETPAGMLNAVGLQNQGIDHFIQHIYPQIRHYDTNIIVNLCGCSIDDYVACAEKVAALDRIPAIELNISCPNVKNCGMAFGVDPQATADVVRAVRRAYPKTLIVKLSPNVTSITDIAQAAEAEGADALSLINTVLAMAIDINHRRPVLPTITGGLSGPCIKPIALRMVWQTYQAVRIPIFGIGGITNWQDAVEFLLAGATAIQIGTHNFIDPAAALQIIAGINQYCDQNGFSTPSALTASAHPNP